MSAARELHVKAFKRSVIHPSMKYLYAYRTIALPSLLVTSLAALEYMKAPSLSAVLFLLWIKFVTSGILIAYLHFFRGSLTYFFMNLGLGRFHLYGSILIVDLIVFSICLLVISLFN